MALPALTASRSVHQEEEGGKDSERAVHVRKGESGVSTSEAAGGGGSSGRLTKSPFDRLPDEVVSSIVTFAEPDQTLNSLCLNKRWPGVHPLIQQFDAAFPRSVDCLSYDCAILSLFRNLRFLIFWGSFSQQADPAVLPIFFTDFVRNLPSLTHLALELHDSLHLKDATSTVGQGLPRLRSLRLSADVEEPTCIPRLLAPPYGTLRSLKLWLSPVDEAAYTVVPWSTLDELELETLPSNKEDARCVDALLASLKEVVQNTQPTSPVSLRRFILSDPIFSTQTSRYQIRHDSRLVLLFFELFQTAAVQELSIALDKEAVIPPDLPTLPAVRRLTVDVPGHDLSLMSIENYNALLALLALFPSVQTLELLNVSFGRASQPGDPNPPSPAFFNLHPPLLTFLLFLRTSTAVTRFLWDGPHEGPRTGRASHEWSRAKKAEDFEVETFRWR